MLYFPSDNTTFCRFHSEANLMMDVPIWFWGGVLRLFALIDTGGGSEPGVSQSSVTCQFSLALELPEFSY